MSDEDDIIDAIQYSLEKYRRGHFTSPNRIELSAADYQRLREHPNVITIDDE